MSARTGLCTHPPKKNIINSNDAHVPSLPSLPPALPPYPGIDHVNRAIGQDRLEIFICNIVGKPSLGAHMPPAAGLPFTSVCGFGGVGVYVCACVCV